MTGDELVAIVRARGSDARDPRDAAHEAHHALDAGVRGRWERERVHRALMRKCDEAPGLLVVAELDARAVEQMVCRDLGVVCWSIDRCAEITALETIRNMNIALPNHEWIVERITERIDRPRIRQHADRVLALTMPRRMKRS